jgi:hypothetical protein
MLAIAPVSENTDSTAPTCPYEKPRSRKNTGKKGWVNATAANNRK